MGDELWGRALKAGLFGLVACFGAGLGVDSWAREGYNPSVSKVLARPPKTVEDYLKLPEGALAELIEGEILMSPSPQDRHQRSVGNAYFALRTFVTSKRLGQVRMAPLDVYLPSGSIVQPDVLFVSTSNEGILQDWVRGVPDLVVEILSPESVTRDRIVKRDLYSRNGAREYWIVDPEAATVGIFSLVRGRYEPYGFFRRGESVESPLLAGLSIPVDGLFA